MKKRRNNWDVKQREFMFSELKKEFGPLDNWVLKSRPRALSGYNQILTKIVNKMQKKWPHKSIRVRNTEQQIAFVTNRQLFYKFKVKGGRRGTLVRNLIAAHKTGFISDRYLHTLLMADNIQMDKFWPWKVTHKRKK